MKAYIPTPLKMMTQFRIRTVAIIKIQHQNVRISSKRCVRMSQNIETIAIIAYMICEHETD